MRVLGRIESLWRYPVKSMRGEKLHEVFAGFPGVYGDRAYAFHCSAAPKGFPFFTARDQEQMLLYRATYRHGERMALPSNWAEAEALGSGVTPLYAGPVDRMVDVMTPSGEVLSVDHPRLIELLLDGGQDGHVLSLLRSERALTDCRPISLISLQTVQQLSLEAGVELDERRFRANLYVDLPEDEGFAEDTWINRRLRIGAKVEIVVLARDARCKMITLNPDTGQSNPDILRCVAKGHQGKAGVYAAVVVEGMIRAGDAIALPEADSPGHA